VKMTP